MQATVDREQEGPLGALDRGGQRPGLAEVPGDNIDLAGEGGPGRVAGEHAYLLSLIEELADDAAPDLSGGSGHQDHEPSPRPTGGSRLRPGPWPTFGRVPPCCLSGGRVAPAGGAAAARRASRCCKARRERFSKLGAVGAVPNSLRVVSGKMTGAATAASSTSRRAAGSTSGGSSPRRWQIGKAACR